MSTRATIWQPPPSVPRGTPPLEPGDQLTREEFERRYDAMPLLKKAELIEGVVHMPPPAVRFDYHGGPHADLMTWLGTYRFTTPGVKLGDNSSVRLDLENEPQPDALLFIEPRFGGQVKLSADGYIEGAPELVAEVSGTTASIDLNTKLRVYRRNGVREYLVWRVFDRAIDWFALHQGKYVPLMSPDGVLRSDIFPGLWLDPSALIREELTKVIEVLQQGTRTAQHAEFVARLKSQAAGQQD